ncbi:hypothetical protein OEZ86_010058 [Tetradesmus obliquus]|uniref:Leucine-rich repeat-containing N-terminal plant-type domain-containing protein n=1 Tax=Tetradesmus obliquus TaxID=3088 RepID=A0ABY8UQE0_TETOB|nr:hypothetical protein OEZ85_001493 [Tetradesmus obliquus]WIA43614.1 hypothetical protein OEZ86_010058 [Tetradesmus obliquus]
MPKTMALYVSDNKQLTGSIPASWVHFATGVLCLSLDNTQVGGCLPDGLVVDIELEPCSVVSPEAAALAQLKLLLEAPGISAGPGLSTWAGGTNYCGGSWAGITCEGPSTVIDLNLTALAISVQGPATLPLLNVVAALSNLTDLQTLSLAGIGLSGPVHEPGRPSLDSFTQLRHLDISGNPALSGDLPSSWFAMRGLTTLDISATGIKGTLPEDFAAFQELRVFRAVACPGVTGSLPPAWGLLKLERLRVLDLSLSAPGRGGLGGALPAAFAQLEQLQVLVLSGHNFNGSLPQAWTRLSQLRVLDVSRNSLTGSLPKWYASMLQLAVLKVHDNQLVPATSGSPEFFEYLVGDGLKLQCLCVGNNSGVLLDAAKAAELKRRAQASSPPAQLVIDQPTDRLCVAQAWQ